MSISGDDGFKVFRAVDRMVGEKSPMQRRLASRRRADFAHRDDADWKLHSLT